jgi:tetratricopeptide (TPR) repeat protein
VPFDPDAEDTRRDELPLVDGRFELKRIAGTGGMGKVYAAFDRVTGQPVAVKVLSATGGDARRFAREAAVLADLIAPTIVRYVAHGVTPTGAPYLAMEWVDGEPLNVRLGRGKMPVRDAVVVVRRVAEALAVAHRRGIVHRDIKPSNVLLERGAPQRAKLIDFGVARDQSDLSEMTAAGTIVGTPGYVAPELLGAKGTVAPTVDLYALGALLFRAVTGRLPFEADDVIAILMRVAHEKAPRLASLVRVAPLLDELVASLLAKNPEDRPPDAEMVVEILQRVEESNAPPPLPSNRPVRALGRSELRTFSVVVGALPSEPAPGVMRQLAEGIAPHGGVIEVAVGSSFTATVPRGGIAADQALRAVNVALTLHALAPEARLAVASGRHPVNQAEVGPVVDRASALVRDRSPGDVAIDELTRGLVGDRLELRSDGGVHLVRGFAEVVSAPQRLLGRVAPYVGRDAELYALGAMAERCASQSSSSIALVTGPPGIGKSRLANELVARLAERGLNYDLWIAPCDAVSAGVPYALFVRAIERALAVPGKAPDPARQRKWLATRLGRYLPSDEAERIRELVGDLVGLPNPEPSIALQIARRDGRLFADQLRRGLVDWLRAEAAERPLLFLLEDLHWADRTSIKLLGDILRDLETSPIFVVALARPELRDRFPKLWSGRVALEMELGTLSRQASEKFARAMLEGASDEVVRSVAERAAGHPLYLEELVRDATTETTDRPETLLALVEARVAEQEVEARRVLRAAAVFGESFCDRGVDALLGGESAADWLEVLVEREILQRTRRVPFPGTIEYQFRHGLVRDAAYATLTAEDRALGHRLAAAWLDEMGEDGFIVAKHLERAGDEAGAATKYSAEVERLIDESDIPRARAVAERALASAGGAAPELYRVLYQTSHWLSDPRAATDAVRQWLDSTTPHTAARFEALGAAINNALRGAEHEYGFALAEELVHGEPLDAAANEELAIALADVGGALLLSGAYDLAQRAGQRLDRALKEAGGSSFRVISSVSRFRGIMGVRRGFPEEAVTHFREAARSFEAIGDARRAAHETGNLAHAFNELGDWVSAEAAARENLAATTELGIATNARYTLARALAGSGRIAEAKEVYERAIAELREQGQKRMEAMARGHYADLLLREGDPASAELHAREATGLDASPSSRRRAEAALARALVARGRVHEAEPIAQRLMEEVHASEWAELGDVAVRLTAAVVAAAVGDEKAYWAAVDEGKALIRRRADTIRDPILREAFLTEVPENADLLAR